MSSPPQITTIVPTYRRPALLRRAVFSVLRQTYPDFIVRIQDNASGDETGAVAQELMRADARVQYHVHRSNIGGLNNIIDGIAHVATPHFNVLSDDDLLMPDFFELAMRIHERAHGELAFVSTRIVTVAGAGRFSPAAVRMPGRMPPPDGVVACLVGGASMPGVIYRTGAMEAVGPPRAAWWNWTESGWNALAALRSPIEFSAEVGAIVQLHAGNTSKLMSARDFRISWFRMLVELREFAGQAGLSSEWWKEHVLPIAWRRFYGSVVRLCGSEGIASYDVLQELAVASGLSRTRTGATLGIGRLLNTLGVGALINRLGERSGVSRVTTAAAVGVATAESDAASRVFHDLNRQAGVDVSVLG